MLSSTHAYIAGKICENLKENRGIISNKLFFKYGSVKPDFVPELFKVEHFQYKSFDFGVNRINALSNQPFPKDKKSLKSYSMDLGVIIHFLSDYFCAAHNKNNLMYNMFKHYIYELYLKSRTAKFENSFRQCDISQLSDILTVKTGDFVLHRLNSYRLSKASCFNDLQYALAVSLTVCEIIINSSMDISKSAAA